MKLGIVSDTHGTLHPGIVDLFQGVDAIIHAGDIGKDQVLFTLKKIAPVMAVRGNMDAPPFSYDLPGYRVSQFDERKIMVTHRVGNPNNPSPRFREMIQQVRPDVVVFGHTHHPFNERINGILFFNPGSAGQPRGGYRLSVGFLFAGSDGFSGEIVYLDE